MQHTKPFTRNAPRTPSPTSSGFGALGCLTPRTDLSRAAGQTPSHTTPVERTNRPAHVTEHTQSRSERASTEVCACARVTVGREGGNIFFIVCLPTHFARQSNGHVPDPLPVPDRSERNRSAPKLPVREGRIFCFFLTRILINPRCYIVFPTLLVSSYRINPHVTP